MYNIHPTIHLPLQKDGWLTSYFKCRSFILCNHTPMSNVGISVFHKRHLAGVGIELLDLVS